MFVYEVWFIDGCAWCSQRFESRYEAQEEMVQFINDSSVYVDYCIVKEIDE